jgi:hypothetical protein
MSLAKLPQPPLGALPADLELVEGLVKRSGSSFYYGMRMLPPARRAAVYSIYASTSSRSAGSASPRSPRAVRMTG